jgi:hypothetical protein
MFDDLPAWIRTSGILNGIFWSSSHFYLAAFWNVAMVLFIVTYYIRRHNTAKTNAEPK